MGLSGNDVPDILEVLSGVVFDEVVAASVCQYSQMLVRCSSQHHSCRHLVDCAVSSAGYKASFNIRFRFAVVADKIGCRAHGRGLIYLIINDCIQPAYLVYYLRGIQHLVRCVVYYEAVVHAGLTMEIFSAKVSILTCHLD